MSFRSSGGNLSRHIYSLQHMTAERVGLSFRLARRWSLRFPKRGAPLNCCSSSAASFFRPPSFCLFCHAPYPFLPCGLAWPTQRLHHPWYAQRCFIALLPRWVSSLAMGVQFSRFSAEHIFLLTFALPCITLNSYLDIAFKNFVPVHKDKNRKIFIFK